MRTMREALQAALARVAAALSLTPQTPETPGPNGAEPQQAEPGPTVAEDREQDLLDRERQLHLLMASWWM